MTDGYRPLDRSALEEHALMARDAARATKAQFDAYREQGFTDHQALALTLNWQTLMFGGAA